MNSFTFNGRKYINGYACDSLGRPITLSNGYSSEDEKDARQDYLDAVSAMKNKPSAVKETAKYSKKTTLQEPTDEELMALFQQEYTKPKRYSEDGYLLNDAGEKISFENGYTDKDESFTKRQVKSMNF